ncbi:MAG: ribosome recycling factor [Dehalococcoidia bacterium]|nr:ribosome recycling factor [Dehalococcoidia bacterium]
MTEEVLMEAEERMEKAVEAFRHTLASVRTGRASTSLVEHIAVDQYGQKMQLIQLATLSAPEAQLITVQPWDKGSMNSIMKALQQSDLGITPQSDGSIIRLPIPPLTEERRKEMVKQVHGKTEDARVSIRNARRSAMDELKKALRNSDVSEDDERRSATEVERLTSDYVEKVDALAKEKEQELLAV